VCTGSVDLQKNAKHQLERRSNKHVFLQKVKEDRNMLNTIWHWNIDGWYMQIDMKSYCKKSLKEECRAKACHGRKRLHMLSDVASSQESIWKWKGQKNIDKDGELQTDEECHKSATQQTTKSQFVTYSDVVWLRGNRLLAGVALSSNICKKSSYEVVMLCILSKLDYCNSMSRHSCELSRV